VWSGDLRRAVIKKRSDPTSWSAQSSTLLFALLTVIADMRFSSSVSWLTLSSCLLSISGTLAQSSSPSQWPVHDNGLNEVVQWDHYSFKVNGKRLFVFSGEIHYWRIPVPNVWDDLLEKIKAAGFTACKKFTRLEDAAI
jgi:hypothetical protein